MVIKKDDYGMIKLGSVNSKESIETFSGYLKQFFKSLKKMSKEDQLLLSKYYVQVLGKSREKSEDVYKILNENSFLNRMLKNTGFKENSLVYFSFETGEFSIHDDLEQVTPIHKSIYITNMHGLFTEFLKTGAFVFNKINESPGYQNISYELMDLEIEYEYYEDFDDYYGSSYPELGLLIKEKTNRQVKFVNEVYKKLTDKTIKKYCDFAAEYFLTDFVRTDLEKFVSWVHDDLDVKSINSITEIIEKYYPKTKLCNSYEHLSCNNERYEVEKHNIRRGAEAFFNLEILGLSKVVELLDLTLAGNRILTANTSSYESGYMTIAEKTAKLTFESLEFLSPYYPLSEVFNRSNEKLKLTLSTNSYGFYNLPKNTQDEIIKSSKKVVLELPDKMSEYLLKNKLKGLFDKLSSLNTFYMYMSGSGNEAANNLVDCKLNGLEWSEKFSDLLGLFLKTILNSKSDHHWESLNMLSSLSSQFAFNSGVLPRKDFNKFALVDNDAENMLLLKTSDQNFELDVQALCNRKQLPIDSFAIAKIDSVTIKGLDKMKMEYAVNAFDTLYNLLLNNDNILVDQLNFDILNVFQKTFEYNLIGLQNRQNSELSEFIKRIIKNNNK
jgi:hypothetical protein